MTVAPRTPLWHHRRLGSFQPDDVRRLKQLEQENARLKKLVAERDLEIEVMKEIAAKNGRRAGLSRAGGICRVPWRVATTVLHVAGRGPSGSGLPVDEGRDQRKELLTHVDTGVQGHEIVILSKCICAEASYGHSNTYPQAIATLANVVASLGAGGSRNRY